MAGHSHWKNIKRTKEADSKKRSLLFAKIGRNITVLSKEKGGDLDANPTLRLLVEKAKSINMPKENIERAIKKGTGELKGGDNLESFVFEGYGPGGIAFLAEGITDNKNRTIAEFKKTVSDFGGKVADVGSVQWMFDRKTCLSSSVDENNKEDIEFLAIDLGAEDVFFEDDAIKIFVKPELSEDYKKNIKQKTSLDFESFLVWVPKTPMSFNENEVSQTEVMFEKIISSEDIQEIFSNIKK